ncbi:hypothetical protein B9G39_15725 [Zooshikella ganghwensis]|uniref:Uncharacterized protein n=1 Tax=Zooshikella ganghwensis TaxID=202772 RepID=A0A4P9VMW9_9GAMM|nr:hypothetical protein B9G39_15725 [Zooshikella ganghwensis]
MALLSVSIAWGSPRESAERYVNLLLSGEFHKSAEMYHSEALENIRNAIFPIIELEIENDVKDG